ncbi:MAG: pectate lyase [Pseudomonadota bacterium]
MRILVWTAVVALGLAASSVAVAQPAFPGAQGFGAETRGGRGGRVIEVTNLNDAGAGSLRAAIEAAGPRIVVFRVAGTIQLASDLRIRAPFITIAGQSAPGGGVTLRDHPLIIEADEVIVRYIRSRLGDESHIESDAIWVARGRNVMLDHVSASWSVDETLSVSQHEDPGPPVLDNVTVQWSIIAESLDHSIHSKGAHGYGSLVRGANGARYSFVDNLWAHHHARMPRPGNYLGIDQDATGPLIEFVNNVFYNWGGDHAGYDADTNAAVRTNFIGNYYLAGPNSSVNTVAFQEQNAGAKAYFADNWWNGAAPADPWSLVRMQADNPDYRQAQPFSTPTIAQSADAAFAAVLAQAGVSKSREAVDARVVQSVRERNGRIIDSQRDVGGWPELAAGAPYPDEDHDGMSDDWERAHGLNPHDARDGARMRADGYTNVEAFLNELAAQ